MVAPEKKELYYLVRLYDDGSEPEEDYDLADNYRRAKRRLKVQYQGQAATLIYHATALASRIGRDPYLLRNDLATKLAHETGKFPSERVITGWAEVILDTVTDRDCVFVGVADWNLDLWADEDDDDPEEVLLAEIEEVIGPDRGVILVERIGVQEDKLWFVFTDPSPDANQHLSDLTWAKLRFG